MIDRDLSDYLLGEASPQERAALEARLAADPALRARLQRLEAVTQTLEGMPEAAWRAALDESQHPFPAVTQARRPSSMSLPRLGVAVLAAVILFVAGAGAGALIVSGGSSVNRGTALALHPLAGGPTAVSGVAYLTGSNRMVLVIRRLPKTKPGSYYEAWLMTNIHVLVPLAGFRVNAHGGARLTLQLPASPRSYRYLDVSLQSPSSGGAHSALSVLRGPTT